MTKKLSKEEKKQRKEDRRIHKLRLRQAKQQKVEEKVPGPPESAPATPPPPVNLCDDCAYEFGECEGKPKFASDQDETLTGPEADRVVECPAFVNVAKMPTAQEAAVQGPAAADELEKLQEEKEREDDAHREEETESVTAEAEVQVIRTDLPERPDPKRFQAEEDFGNCSCGSPLKRTALNRYQDAIRCVNPRCSTYRVIVKTISTGVK